MFMLVEPDLQGLREISTLVEEGRLRVIVDATFPVERAAEAHAMGETVRTTGKIVLTVGCWLFAGERSRPPGRRT
ncbi:zinc-binding dehydrogenase [Streptomyces sp. NPDC056367]|uniref:zinc-binding dehydrogenase n=1 Tax=Streptomyces sp. NPDC056367 TaxID=3345797 RepID=UPI0035DADFF5